ncbi:MAG TPA: hypothetical protein VFQ45_02525, partial [Longimicrobium sp.]|nr:hypothetical protein [Longimicrobium sp.]
MTAAAEGPYKGLVPYGEEDADYFFGRDGERRIITANLMAHRLTLLYGQSGVGKSSLLRAGVARDLGALAESNVEGAGSPGFAVVVAGAWRDDPLRMLADAVRRAAEPLLAEPDPGPPQGAALAEVLAHWSERLDADLLVVLDQFEEYFLYHGHEGTGPGSFPWQLAQAVNHPTLRARFLVSLREDALASLDAFKGLIPRLFENYLRVGHLDPRSAREAVVKPLATFSAEHPGRAVKAEPGLVDAVLAEIQGGKVALGDRGHGALRRDEAAAGEIEAPYLQLVMTRLWREEMRLKSGTLRLQTYRKLGGAARIVSTHLDEVMKGLSRADRETASRLFRYLVTPGGAKIAHTAETLAYYTRVPEARVTRTLKLLAGQRIRILRESDGAYQIFHDVMGPAVLGWRQRHAAARRERNLGIGGTGLMAAVVAGLVFFALRPAAARVERAHERLVAGLLEQDREVLADRRYVPADSGRALGDAGSGDTLPARFRAAA